LDELLRADKSARTELGLIDNEEPEVIEERPAELAFLTCPRCIWEIDQAQLDKPPWSGSRQHYRCPGCGSRVEWHIHRPAWPPAYGAAAS
jgi:hypothetical protein